MKKRCKRKVYAKINTIDFVLEGIKPAEGNRLQRLQTMELSSLEAFRTGTATEQDWWHLTSMMNVAEQMAVAGIGIEVQDITLDARKHLIDAAKRFQKTKRMGFTGEGLKCLRDLYEYHDLQRKSVTLAEYERHLKKLDAKIRGRSPHVEKAICADSGAM